MQKLQFRPPLEEVRAKYYRELKKFLGIPNKFKGVQEVESTGGLLYLFLSPQLKMSKILPSRAFFLHKTISRAGGGAQPVALFSVMVERNAHRFDSVYRKAEDLFERLQAVQVQFKVGMDDDRPHRPAAAGTHPAGAVAGRAYAYWSKFCVNLYGKIHPKFRTGSFWDRST